MPDKKNLAKEWHSKNNVSFEHVRPSSHKKYWWLCDKGHEWEARADHRSNGSGCPYCVNQKVLSGFNDLSTINPKLAKEWHPIKNGNIQPTMVIAKTDKNAWWLGECGHEWQARILGRMQGNGCPYCSGQKVLSGFNDLETVNSELASEWHPNNIRKPSTVTASSTFKAWWIGKCGHEWEAKVSNRNRKNSSACPYCGHFMALPGFNDLETVNPELAGEWNYKKNEIVPSEVTAHSNKKVWWLGKCGHEWEAIIHNRDKGYGCPICANRIIVSGFNDLETTNPELSKEWHEALNEGFSPSQVSSGSHSRVWWICGDGHEWKAIIYNRANNNSSCPSCNKGGFNPSLPSSFYFIYHKDMVANKIGIANNHAGRVDAWIQNGWEIIYQISESQGNKIRDLETRMLRWIRKDLGLKQELKSNDMHGMGGSTETFSSSIDKGFVISKINEVWSELNS